MLPAFGERRRRRDRTLRRGTRTAGVRVHTGKGDAGSTGLLFGGRVRKDAPGPDAYGTIDETVAALGLARADASGDLAALILHLQKELFVVGAELATGPENRSKLVDGSSRVSAAMAEDLARQVAGYEERLPELTEFAIPGGSRLSAALDLARTVCRRAERLAVRMTDAGDLDNPDLLRYLNLLSDLLFLMARDCEPDLRTLHDADTRE